MVITTEQLRELWEVVKDKVHHCRQCGAELRATDYANGPCYSCSMKNMDEQQGNHWADHVLRRCEDDAEFRERLRKALGVE